MQVFAQPQEAGLDLNDLLTRHGAGTTIWRCACPSCRHLTTVDACDAAELVAVDVTDVHSGLEASQILTFLHGGLVLLRKELHSRRPQSPCHPSTVSVRPSGPTGLGGSPGFSTRRAHQDSAVNRRCARRPLAPAAL